VPITLSGGCATWLGHAGGKVDSEFIEQADLQLYRAKQQGRNCICGIALTQG
jgi:PleD family two-component response regulator